MHQQLSYANRADVVMVFVHWGQWPKQKLTSSRNITGLLLPGGVDAVIGTHPHVVQKWELLKRMERHMRQILSDGKGSATTQNADLLFSRQFDLRADKRRMSDRRTGRVHCGEAGGWRNMSGKMLSGNYIINPELFKKRLCSKIS